MIYTELTKKAIKLAFEAHNNQFDRSGLPFVMHPLYVADQMQDETTTIVALLHDVVEDTYVTLEDIEKYGFGKEVVEALDLLTHKDGVKYLDYIRALSTNPIARKVKIADVKHNMTRHTGPNDKVIKKMPLYEEALKVLNELERTNKTM